MNFEGLFGEFLPCLLASAPVLVQVIFPLRVHNLPLPIIESEWLKHCEHKGQSNNWNE